MTWLQPLGLLGLLAVPVLIALSLWRRQRREAVTSSLLLWHQVAEQRRHAPATRPRRRIDPLLAVRVATALALTGALCGFVWLRPERRSRRLVLVLDRSASMASRRPGGSSRWEACRADLLDLLSGLGAADRVHLVPVPLPSGASAPGELGGDAARQWLRALSPSDAPLRPQALVRAARDAARTWPDAQLVVATDDALEGLPPGGAVLAAGGASDNRGIVAFAARRRPDGRHEVLVRVAHAGKPRADVEVALLADGKPVPQSPLTVSRSGADSVVFETRLDESVTRLEARLAGEDALAADDSAWLARRAGPVRVALVGDANYHLRRALAAAGGVELAELPEPPAASVPAGCDLTVYYHVAPNSLARGPTVVVAPRGPVGKLRPLEAINAGHLTSIQRRDPLMNAVELDDVAFGQVARLVAPPGFEVLAQAGDAPLIGRWREGRAQVVYVGIDPASSHWPLKPSFPIFWANVVASAAAGSGSGDFASARPGEVCRLGREGEEVTVRGPGGEARAALGGVFRPEQVGLYEGHTPGGETRLAAVSLLSEAETTAVGSRVALPAGFLWEGTEARSVSAVLLSGWLALAGLVLILLHGWLARRAERT